MSYTFKIFFLALVFGLPAIASGASQYRLLESGQTLIAKKSSSKKRGKKKKRRKKKKKQPAPVESDSSMDEDESGASSSMSEDGDSEMQGTVLSGSSGPKGMAFGAGGGWEAIYGNGISVHFFPSASLDFHGGVGYNTSGLKFGAGGGMNFFVAKFLALRVGAVFSHSTGNDGTVSLNAKFTPEGSGSSEDIVAEKKYEISASQALGLYSGVLLKMTNSIYLNVLGNYNAVVGGNEVALGEDIEYDKSVQITNTDSFEPEFNSKAEEQATAGGLGFSIGLLMFL